MVADHFGVIGHFSDPGSNPPHYDWLKSGSNFRRTAFDGLWNDIAAYLLASDA
ncbi:MAG: hypothetical protein ACI9MR_002867 [Myxococcota bacterium]